MPAKNKPLNIAIVYGGTSPEREFTFESALPISNTLLKFGNNIFIFYISKYGEWNHLSKIQPIPILDKKFSNTYKSETSQLPKILKYFKKFNVEVVFPILHGWLGEDGRIQSLCEWLNIPCVGSGAMASAISLNKNLFKNILIANNLPVIEYICFKKIDFYKNNRPILENVDEFIGYPCVLKPVHGGSSVGIFFISKFNEIALAVNDISNMCYDAFLIEKYIKIKDIEVGVIGNDMLKIGEPVEMVYNTKIYDYEQKCLTDEKIVPSTLSNIKINEIKNLAGKVYSLIGCRGLARIDFFLDSSFGNIYINEINTIPYLKEDSSFSLSLKENLNYSFGMLLCLLLELSFEVPPSTIVAYRG